MVHKGYNMEQGFNKYPVGIQTFSEIIRNGYTYIDKTEQVWDLAHYAKYIFMSRPRRFGKSLLTSTLEAYFNGKRDLFTGLEIMKKEKEWKQHPVIHLDLSMAKGQDSPNNLKETLMWLLSPLVETYGKEDIETTPGKLLSGILRRAYKRHGKQVVILVDEYDAPLLDTLNEKDLLDGMRKVMQEFYQPLKTHEAIVKFCFITGITKFSQLSIFSTINNMVNVTLDPTFSAICGITEQELRTTLWSDVEMLAKVYGESAEDMHTRLKLRYDGYHFSERSPEVYNPFSLLSAFLMRKVSNWWFATGTPTFLIQQMLHFNTDITSFDNLHVTSSAFDQPTENMEDALPLLYQSGYLTIKDYDQDTEIYTLSIPNQEVRTGYASGLLPTYTGLKSSDVQAGFAVKFWQALKNDNIDLAMSHMQAYLAGIPYVEGFKKKLAEAATAEGFYEYTLYLIFSMLNAYVRTQVKTARGRTDVVVFMPNTIYVIELKVGTCAKEALSQINNNGYAEPYMTANKQVVKVGVSFNKDTRTIDEWMVEKQQ